MATWGVTAAEGDPVAVSGTGRGYDIDLPATAYLLAGDESALPAITTILDALPAATQVTVVVEVGSPEAKLEVGGPEAMALSWHVLPSGASPGDALVAAVEAATIDAGSRVWVAGEAASVQRIRRHLFEVRGLERSQCSVRGYWKHGRAGDDG